MLLDAAEGDEEARPFLQLDLYAERCQRAFQLGLSALRREQRRREERMRPEIEEGADAQEDVAVELGEDPAEDAYFLSKATATDEDPPEPEDLTQYIHEASAEAVRAAAGYAQHPRRQNKATAGPGGAQPRGNGKVEKTEAEHQPAPEPTPAARYDGPVEPKREESVEPAAAERAVPARDEPGPGVDEAAGGAGTGDRAGHDPARPAAVPVVGAPDPGGYNGVDQPICGLRGWRPGYAPGGIFRAPTPPDAGPAPGT
jgi:hypothetical protein